MKQPESDIPVNVRYLCRNLKIARQSGEVKVYAMVVVKLKMPQTCIHKLGIADIENVELIGLENYLGESPGIIYDGTSVTLTESNANLHTIRFE